MSPAERKEYIDNVLKVKKVVLAVDVEAARAYDDDSEYHVIPLTKDKAFSIMQPDDVEESVWGGEHCAICLGRHKAGEEIGLSHNQKCSHSYHRECISEWLLEHDDCPFCRNSFLEFDDNHEESSPLPQCHATAPYGYLDALERGDAGS